MSNRNAELLGKMDVKKALVKLAIPATIGMMVNATYNLVDSLFVSWGAGTDAIGGLTLAYPVQMIVVAIALMIGIGGASVFSRAYGRGDKEAMHNTVNTAVRIGLFSGLTIAIFGSIFITPLLNFFGAVDSNIGYAQDYLSVILYGITFQTISMILNNFTRAEGRAKVAMFAMVIGTGTNIILDPIFIFDWGFGLGVQGAAIATAISQVLAFTFITVSAFAPDSVLNITFKDFFKIDPNALWETIKIGSPTFIRNAIGGLLVVLIVKMINNYAISEQQIVELTAIYGVVYRVIMFIFMPAFGIVQGFAPIAGFNFGARQWERLIELVKYTTKLLTIYFIGGFILVMIGAEAIFDVFSSDNDPVFINEGARIFRLIAIGFIPVTFQVISGSVYQAFGYAWRALFISLSRQFILFVPILFILTPIFKLDGLWYTFGAADIISGLIGLTMLIYEVRALRQEKVVAQEIYE